MRRAAGWLMAMGVCLACAVGARSAEPPVPERASGELAAAQRQLADLTAEFVLTVQGAGPDGRDLRAGGRIWLAAGRRYRVEYTRPEAQILVSNGRRRWLYLKKINQVQVQALPPAGNPGELFLELGGGLPALLARCRVRELDSEDGLRVYELTPLPGEALQFQSARLWLSGPQRIPRRIEVEAARRVRVEFSEVTVHTLEELRRNPDAGVPAARFTFTAPADAEVIEPLWPE